MKRKLLCYYLHPDWYKRDDALDPRQNICIDEHVTMRDVNDTAANSDACLIIAMDVCPPRILRNDFEKSFRITRRSAIYGLGNRARFFWRHFKKENHRLPDIYVDLAGNIVRAKDGAVLMAAT